MILKKPQGASKQKLVKSAQHSGSKWLKPAKNKLTGSDFTSFSMQISVDWRHLRFRSLHIFLIMWHMNDRVNSISFFQRKFQQIGIVSVSGHCMCFILRRCQNVAGIRIIASISLVFSKKVSADCPYFRFRSVYVPIHIENLLNCSRHKKNRVHFTNYLF